MVVVEFFQFVVFFFVIVIVVVGVGSIVVVGGGGIHVFEGVQPNGVGTNERKWSDVVRGDVTTSVGDCESTRIIVDESNLISESFDYT